ncbi:Thiamine-monophosphate kinase (EC [uncultured Gammaproteobacteria bacterium]|nr:Thiamine-monophosphate kinase (EC [uncultured Gammaproteobacteria bacterium]
MHFPANTSAQDIAYKALAVNLSDLAAMGATPLYFTLALSLPSVDKKWLADFSQSLKALAKQYNISLVGGDTSKVSSALLLTPQVL